MSQQYEYDPNNPIITMNGLKAYKSEEKQELDKIQASVDEVTSNWGDITGCAQRLEVLVWGAQS